IANDINRCGRIRAGQHCPDELLEIRDVDVVVDDDHVPAGICPDVTLTCDMSSLSRVTRIALPDRYPQQQTRSTDLMRPGRRDIRYAGAGEIFPQHSRADDRLQPRDLVRRPQWRAPEQDWIIPVIDGLYVHHRLVANLRAVIAHPFPEW